MPGPRPYWSQHIDNAREDLAYLMLKSDYRASRGSDEGMRIDEFVGMLDRFGSVYTLPQIEQSARHNGIPATFNVRDFLNRALAETGQDPISEEDLAPEYPHVQQIRNQGEEPDDFFPF